MYKLYQGDCLELMKDIPDNSVNCILCDLPYGNTNCKWDTIIPFEELWKEYKRIRKENTAIILFGVEPFSSYLRISNITEYRYDWIWKKERPTNPLTCRKNPPRYTENISIFYKKLPYYNPQKIRRKEENKRNNKVLTSYTDNTKRITKSYSELSLSGNNDFIYHPNILEFSMERGHHPTQKPTKLLEFLIKTYTNEGDLVLDNTMGSGSTGVACMNLGRKFIGIEKEENYFKIAEERIKEASNNLNKFME